MKRHEHTLIKCEAELTDLVSLLAKQKLIGLDLETEGLQWWGGHNPVGIGLGIFEQSIIRTWYIPIRHQEKIKFDLDEWQISTRGNLDELKVYNSLEPILINPKIAKIGANIKFDAHFLRSHVKILPNLHDVQILARLLHTEYPRVALDVLIEREFQAKHEEWYELQKVCRSMGLKVTEAKVEPYAYAKAPPELVGRYCGKDVYWTLRLFERYWKMLLANRELYRLYHHIELPLLQAVIAMEENGVAIDKNWLLKLQDRLKPEISRLEAEVYRAAGKKFNLNSNKELRELFKEFKILPEWRRRKKKDGTIVETYSYDAQALEIVKDDYPLIQALLEYRKYLKLLSTYVEPILKRLLTRNKCGWLVLELHQEAARTGRFSCASPNFQNLPREDQANQEFSIRRAIIPMNDISTLFSIDFVNVEYRLLAHFSNELKLLELFKADGDFHSFVASLLFKKSVSEITKEERDTAKQFNFASLYGASPDSIAKKLKLNLAEITVLYRQYEREFPAVTTFKNRVLRYCQLNKGISNPFGRWRTLSYRLAYMGVNTLIQSTAADILKTAILRVHNFLRDKNSKLLFPVHDELVINHERTDGDIITPITYLMTDWNINGKEMFRVPLTVEVMKCDKSWGDKHELKTQEMLELFFSGERKRELDIKYAYSKNPAQRRFYAMLAKHFKGDVLTEQLNELDHLLENNSSKATLKTWWKGKITDVPALPRQKIYSGW